MHKLTIVNDAAPTVGVVVAEGTKAEVEAIAAKLVVILDDVRLNFVVSAA